jgi:hypothetical protein
MLALLGKKREPDTAGEGKGGCSQVTSPDSESPKICNMPGKGKKTRFFSSLALCEKQTRDSRGKKTRCNSFRAKNVAPNFLSISRDLAQQSRTSAQIAPSSSNKPSKLGGGF